MISMTEYLESIYTDLKNEIDKGKCLCELKGLTFESDCIPNYNNIQIQRLYLLRYAFAYGFEYSHIYSEVLEKLHNPNHISVASIGCGAFLDYWSLIQAIEEKKKINCTVRYIGMDKANWNYKIGKREQDELIFKEGNAIQFFETNKEFISDVYFFPKSISEFNDSEIEVIVKNLKSKPMIKDKIIFCFSLRAYEDNRVKDMAKTQQIIRALEENGYKQKNQNNVCWKFTENKGISWYNNNYWYPSEAYDYVISLNEKCNKYIETGVNCKYSCEQYLNRKPTTKTGNIYYQIIDLERENKE